MFPTFKVPIAFKQLKKDILGNIVGIGTIAQVRQCDSKHDITVILDRLSKCLFFHNHLPVTLIILGEALTLDTLLSGEMFQIQAGKTYQNIPVPFWQVFFNKKTRFPVGKRVFGRTVNVLGNYSSSLSLASSASSVSTSWLSSSSREAMSSLIAPLAGAFLSSIGAPRSSSSASA